MRYDLTDFEWSVIEPLLPTNRPGPKRVDDRRVLNGIFWVLRSGAPWRDLPERYGPYTTVHNRFNRWGKAGVWDRIMDAITEAYDGDIQMIASSSGVRTVERTSLGPHRSIMDEAPPLPLHHRFGLRSYCSLSSLIVACDRCIAALTAIVVLAQPCSICPIGPPVLMEHNSQFHHTVGQNT